MSFMERFSRKSRENIKVPAETMRVDPTRTDEQFEADLESYLNFEDFLADMRNKNYRPECFTKNDMVMRQKVHSGASISEERWLKYRDNIATSDTKGQAERQKFYGELRKEYGEKKSQEVRDIIAKLYMNLSGDDMDSLQEEIVTRVNLLKSKYPKWQDSIMMHALSGSTIKSDHAGIFYGDLPGEDSIEQFIKSLLEKYKDKLKKTENE